MAKTLIADPRLANARVALMLPCLNEELTLAKVIRDFKKELPNLEVYVFDNNSTDKSVEIALHEGAKVIRVPKRGKGNVVRKMFELVDADYYIMVDSDDTYDATGIHSLMAPVINGETDMVVASRLSVHTDGAFRKFHRFGNLLIMKLINWIFQSRLADILSGYRVMSRTFVKNIPLMRTGFEVETELTVYSLIGDFAIKEMPLPYRHRPPNSHSKLRTFSDGYKVILTIIWLARDLRPLLFFWSVGLAVFLLGALPSVYFMPESVFLHQLLTTLSVSLAATGMVLNTLHVRFQELQSVTRRQSAGERPEPVQVELKKARPRAVELSQ